MAARSSRSTQQLELLGLDDDIIAAVLEEAPEDSLGSFASASRKLSRLARTRIPAHLEFEGHASTAVLSSQGGPFSGCTSLDFHCRAVADLSSMSLVTMHASKHYTNLTSVTLQCVPNRDNAAQLLVGDGNALVGPLGWLRELSPLRDLQLTTPAYGAHLPAAVAQLTQLTSLVLVTTPRKARADLGPLSSLPQLKALHCQGVAVAAAVEQQSCLPSSLQKLHVGGQRVAPEWWTHLSGCPQLTCLEVVYEGQVQYAASHPSRVTRAAARANMQLQLLVFRVRGVTGLEFTRQAAQGVVEVAAETHWDLPEEAAALTALTELVTPAACLLSVDTDSTWWLLGRLKQLSSVVGLQVGAMPPSRLKLPWQVVNTSAPQLSAAKVLQLMSSWGQLKEYCLTVSVQELHAMQQEQQQQQQEQQEQVPSTTGNIVQEQVQAAEKPGGQLELLELLCKDGAARQQGVQLAAQHFDAVVGSFPHLPGLSVGWPPQDSPQPVLPSLAPLTALTSLFLSSSSDRVKVYWQPEHVLQVLQGKESMLQELTLQGFELVSPRFALMLSDRFPRLRDLQFANCKRLLPPRGPGAGSNDQEEQALQQLQQLLRPGLQLTVTAEPLASV